MQDQDQDGGLTHSGIQHELDEQDEHQLGEDANLVNDTFTEDSLAALIASQVPLQEELHGRMAVEWAKHARIFSADGGQWELDCDATPNPTLPEMIFPNCWNGRSSWRPL